MQKFKKKQVAFLEYMTFKTKYQVTSTGQEYTMFSRLITFKKMLPINNCSGFIDSYKEQAKTTLSKVLIFLNLIQKVLWTYDSY